MSASAAATPRSALIGFVGLGAMGGPMVRRLALLGYDILAYDLNPAAVAAAVGAGARAARSLQEIAQRASLVFTCLPSLSALRAVLDGPDGLRGDALRTVVDCSTTGSEFAQEMSKSLAARGVMLLDAPITGSVVTAGNGKLGIMCSGPRAAFEQAEAPMRDLAGAIVLYLGDPNGRAQRLKLLNNLLSATGMAASCEAFVLGVKWGLDPQLMLQVVNAGEASSSATRNKFASSILTRRFAYGARMAITAKDISLTVKESEELGVPMWIGQAVRQLWHYAASHGGAEQDGTALITFLEAWAGVEVRASEPEAAPAVGPAVVPARTVVVCAEQDGAIVSARMDGAARADVVAVPLDATADRVLEVARMRAGHLIVNLCPLPTPVSTALSRAASDRGGWYLDAAIADSAWRTGRADAMLLVAGPAAVVQAAGPVLASLAPRVLHVAERPGAAHLMQQIEGCLASTLLAVTCEAFVVGARSGLDPEAMTRIMGVETGRNAASERILPTEVATRRFGHGKRIGDACREFEQLSSEAARLGLSPWVLDKARLLYRLAARLGSPEDDISRLALHYEGWGGAVIEAR